MRMGKIKGWRQINKNRWENQKEGMVVWIEEHLISLEGVRWCYRVLDLKYSRRGRISKNFKTRNKAVNNAIKWMKAHPRG